MTDSPDDWFDEARALLQVPPGEDPSWPSPDDVPNTNAPVRWRPRMRRVLLVVVYWAVAAGWIAARRVEAPLVALLSFAAIVGLAPLLLFFRSRCSPAAATANYLAEQGSRARLRRRSWTMTTVGLFVATAAGLSGAVYGYVCFAESSTPFLRLTSLRWGVATFMVGVLLSLALSASRAARRAERTDAWLESEVEFGGPVGHESRVALLFGVAGGLVAALAIVGSVAAVQPPNPADSPANLLVVGESAADDAAWLERRFGLRAQGVVLSDAWTDAQVRFQGDPDQLETLMVLADLHGAGFLLVDLRSFPIDLANHTELSFGDTRGTRPRYAAIATGDVTFVEHAPLLATVGKTRSPFQPLGRHPASAGGPSSDLRDDHGRRLSMARALFAQPAFHSADDSQQGVTTGLDGRSYSLLRGVLYFDLDPDFWIRALATYSDIESQLTHGTTPRALLDP